MYHFGGSFAYNAKHLEGEGGGWGGGCYIHRNNCKVLRKIMFNFPQNHTNSNIFFSMSVEISFYVGRHKWTIPISVCNIQKKGEASFSVPKDSKNNKLPIPSLEPMIAMSVLQFLSTKALAAPPSHFTSQYDSLPQHKF